MTHKKILKTISVFTTIAVLGTSIIGCGGKAQTTTQADTNTAKTEQDTTETAQPASEEKVELTFWTWYPVTQQMEVIEEGFEKENPNIDLVWEVVPDYPNKLTVALGADEAPDVFGVNPNLLYNKVQNYLEPLDALGKEVIGGDWKERYIKEDLEMCYFGGDELKVAPVGTSGQMMILYNRKMFKEMGLEAPKSYDELVQVAKDITAKNKDVKPIAFPLKETWYNFDLYNLILSQSNGAMYRRAEEGEAKFTDAAFVNAFKALQKMKNDGLIDASAVSADYDMVKTAFHTGKLAMFPMGTWEAWNLSQPSRDTQKVALEDVGAFIVPAIDGGDAGIIKFLDVTVGINKKSEHKKEAVKFIEYLTLGGGNDFFAGEFGVVSSNKNFKIDSARFATDAEKQDFETVMGSKALAPRYAKYSLVSDAFGKEVQNVLIDKAAENAAKDVQAVFESVPK